MTHVKLVHVNLAPVWLASLVAVEVGAANPSGQSIISAPLKNSLIEVQTLRYHLALTQSTIALPNVNFNVTIEPLKEQLVHPVLAQAQYQSMTTMPNAKRRKIADDLPQKRSINLQTRSSPIEVPSDTENHSDERESATMDAHSAEEPSATPKTFKELVCNS